jgi:hypothetical protein
LTPRAGSESARPAAPAPPAELYDLSLGELIEDALALFFAYYNLVKIHKTIRMTPAMAAGVTRRPWTMPDLLEAAQSAVATGAAMGAILSPRRLDLNCEYC